MRKRETKWREVTSFRERDWTKQRPRKTDESSEVRKETEKRGTYTL